MAGAELPATARKPAVQGLWEQQKREMEREVVDRFNAAEEMAVEGELVISAIDATSGGTARSRLPISISPKSLQLKLL